MNPVDVRAKLKELGLELPVAAKPVLLMFQLFAQEILFSLPDNFHL